MSRIVGRLFREFAVTLSVAIGISLVVSLTTTPMMCALFLKQKSEERHGWMFRAGERVFEWILSWYETTLGWVLRWQALTMLVTLSTIGITVYLYVVIPKGFFPQQDTGRLTGSLEADQDTSFEAMEKLMNRFAKEVSQDPAVAAVSAFTGGNNGPANSARMFVGLK